jgi:cytochrome P450
MAHQDEDDHRRIVAHRAFPPRRIAELAAAAQRCLDELLDAWMVETACESWQAGGSRTRASASRIGAQIH